MKKNIKTALFTLLVSGIFASGMMAQVADNHSDGGRRSHGHGHNKDGRHHGHGKHKMGGHGKDGRHHHRQLINLRTIYGKVAMFTTNDISVVEGFTLASDSANYSIKFPSQLGSKVTSAVKTGNLVSVTGYSEVTRHGEQFFFANSIIAGKEVVSGVLPAKTTTPPAENLVNISGKIVSYSTGTHGHTTGFVLDTKTIVSFPSQMATQVANLAPVGTVVSVQGIQRPLRDGEVQLEKRTIVAASVITVNGQQYLVR